MAASETAMRALDLILRAEPGHAGTYYAEMISRDLELSPSQAYRLVACARLVLDDRFPGTQRVGWWERGEEKPFARNNWPKRNRTLSRKMRQELVRMPSDACR